MFLKTSQFSANLWEALTRRLAPVWQACSQPQTLAPCRHHQWTPLLLNPQHSKLCLVSQRQDRVRASIFPLPPSPPEDQDSNDNMAEVASAQSQG